MSLVTPPQDKSFARVAKKEEGVVRFAYKTNNYKSTNH